MPFWRCYYHVVWATRHRASAITAEREPVIFAAIEAKSAELGCAVLAVNGTDDHVHVAVAIPPGLAVAEWVRQVKGVSAREVNVRWPDAPERFRWQRGYSVLTFGAKALTFVVDYVQNQKAHHAADALEPYLERIDPPDGST